MNITNFGNIPNITSQITTGAPQAGFRCDPSAAVRSAGRSVTPGTDISGLGTLKNIDEAVRQGYREGYSIRDAAESLWRKETQTFNLKDLDDPEKSKEFLENWRMQARWDLGIGGGPTKDEVISAYIDTLRQKGLDGSVDWSGLTSELDSFKATTSEEQEVTLLGLQFKNLTNQEPRSSTYQKYVNSWQDFLTSIGGGVDVRA